MNEQKDKIVTEQVSSMKCVKCSKELDVSHLPSFCSINCPECGAKQVVPAQFGLFVLLGTLGSGGMGVIYHAVDRELGRHVALKVMKKSFGENPEFVKAFRHEARAAAALNHRNVVQIYSFGQHAGQPYIVMELVDGGGLYELIMDEGQLDEVRTLSIHVEIAEGLKAASDVGLIHGDIKPANILFGANGEAKVVDFGLASFIGQQQEGNEQVWGTPYYIAPEKARKQKIDFRSDIYSLGATLYHALTGQPPFDGPTPLDVVLARLNQPAPSVLELREDLHPETAAMVARMLEASPTMRYPSYPALLYDMREALEKVRGSQSGEPRAIATAVIQREKGAARRKLAIAGIVLAALLLGGGIFAGHIMYQNHKEQVEAERAEEERLQAAQSRGMIAYSRAAELASEASDAVEKAQPLLEKTNEIAESIEDAAPLAAAVSNHVAEIQQAAESASEILQKASDARYGLGMAADSKVADTTAETIESLVVTLEEAARSSMQSMAEAEKSFEKASAIQQEVRRAAREEREKRRKERQLAREKAEREKALEEARRRELLEKQEAERVRLETIQRELDMIDEARGENAPLIARREFDEAVDAFSAVLPQLTQPETKAEYRNVLDAYRSIAGLKRFIISMIKASPYKGGWLLGGTNRDMVDADPDEGLKIALGAAGATFIRWEQLSISDFVRITRHYLESSVQSRSEQADVMLSLALLCYESADFKRAEAYSILACRLNPGLKNEVERMMPELVSPGDLE